MKNLASLQKKINYTFKNISLLKEAMSHASLKNEKQFKNFKINERLELLGDSILNFVITEKIFHKFDQSNEAVLAKTRAYLVSKKMLYQIGQKIGLNKYIIMTKAEEVNGGRANQNTIENALEALLAAIFLDSDLVTIKIFINQLWNDDLIEQIPSDNDVKSLLQELVQAKAWPKPNYDLISKKGSEHAPIFTIKASVKNFEQIADGLSIKDAQKKAAEKLLIIIQNQLNE